ncbi:AMP-binding protein [Spirillospora sp. NPDC127200]
MSGNDAPRPWLSLYGPGVPAEIAVEYTSALEMFAFTAAAHADADALRYFDGRMTWRELDRRSGALAAALADAGFAPGERAALCLQNVPQFVIALLGVWKAGGIAVPVNPMYTARELGPLLRDSGATAMVCLQDLYRDAAREAAGGTGVRTVVTTGALDLCATGDDRVLAGTERVPCPGTLDLVELLERHDGQAPPAVRPGLDDVAVLSYTSGTTGPPKGAMNTHRNLVFSAQAYRDWIGLGPRDVILGIAPLFHITGLVGHVALALLTGAPLVLTYRFEPSLVIDTVARERATFTVGSVTAFIALMNAPNASRRALESLTRIYSGGAPVPPGTVEAFRETFGQYVHNIYGLTETTSPSHAVPLNAVAPVDEATGALSVGVPVFNTDVRIVGDDGEELPPGEIGELVTRGPQVVPGYWGRPEESAATLPGGALRTGDVGRRDEAGWFYLVDRKKDQINASGYKVWPREVEDVLYEHPAVREAAVVGVPDEYRGETVKAFVSLRPGARAAPDELVAFCRERLAAYKAPREVEVLEEIPKTATGKPLRRELRGRR